MSDELKVSLGVREDGRVVHITEIDAQTERGLACHCTCSECGDQLVARLGKVRQRHFAHHTVRDCVTSDESALHRFAKEVFTQHGRFMVPEARVWLDAETLSTLKPRTEEHRRHSREYLLDQVSVRVACAGYVEYAEAILEKGVTGNLRPDVTLMRLHGESPFLVEVRVTHAVDEVKEAALKVLGLPCVEIDLSAHHVGLDSFDRDGIEHLLIDGGDAEKSWIHVENEETHIAPLRERLLREEEEYRLKEERDRQREERRMERVRERERWLADTESQRRARQTELLAPERVAAAEERKQAALVAHTLWQRNCRILGIDPDNVPYYLNEQVKGEYLFAVHRCVWQSTLFVSWVFGKDDPTRSRFVSVEYAVKNLRDTHPDFWEQSLYWAYKDRRDLVEPAAAVGDYFLALRDYGFLEEAGGRPDKPYTWKFQCIRPRVAALPPEYNDKRYLPREDGVLDTQTKQLLKLPPCGAGDVEIELPDTAPNP